MIKDQCAKCRKQNTTDCCSQIIFDGNSCDLYSRKINLDKRTKVNSSLSNEDSLNIENGFDNNSSNHIEPSQQIDEKTTQDHLKKTTEISGWLSFFLFSICIGGILSAIMSFIQFDSVVKLSSSIALAMSDLSFGIILCLLSLYTIYSFAQRNPDAVFLGKLYVVSAFLSNFLALLSGDYEDTGFGSLAQIVRSLVWGIIWFLYLCLSNKVETVIPVNYRRITGKDYYITIGVYLIPILFLAIGIGSIVSTRQNQEKEFVQTLKLEANEYTDGRIVFKSPIGFSCEQFDLEDPKITIFDLENEEKGATIRICSDYDTDDSQKNFNEYWKNWEDDNAKEYTSRIECFEKRRISNCKYWYKVVRYNTENPIYWRFIILFEKSTGKICVLSAYDYGTEAEDYIQGLLQSIRFK